MKKVNIIFPGWALSYDFYKDFINKLPGESVFIDFNFTSSNIPADSCKIIPFEELDKIPIENCNITIISHSIGTLYGLDYLSKGYKTDKFVIIAGFSKFISDKKRGIPGQNKKIVAAMKFRFKINSHAVLRDFYKIALSSADKPLIPFPEQINYAKLIQGLDMLISTDYTDLLKSVKIPVLIIHGTEDKIVPFQTAEFLQCNLPQATLFSINRGGHLLPFSHPDICARIYSGQQLEFHTFAKGWGVKPAES